MSSKTSKSTTLSTSKTLFINNDTTEEVSKYIDNICADPEFLCKNKDLCGKSTSIYSNINNVNEICNNIKEANKCETQFKECVVMAENFLKEGEKYINTSFVNIIIPIKNELDESGNQKFLRLPALSGTKNPNSNDICNICQCMDRFGTSPGAGDNSYTSPGQNQCVYSDNFEYYYYPVSIENINTKLNKFGNLNNTPPIKVGKYTVINSNIIYASSEDDLIICNLYNLLLKNNISDFNAIAFIKKLYPGKDKEIQLCKMNKVDNKKVNGIFYEHITFFYVVFIIFIIFIIFKFF